jgi:predicted transcriptional regulator
MIGETQQQVKAFLAEGLSNKEIADPLHLSLSAVKKRVSELHTQYGLYGPASFRRLIVLLVREKFSLTVDADPSSLPASVAEKN